jgi:arylsulfatase A-like enzyme
LFTLVGVLAASCTSRPAPNAERQARAETHVESPAATPGGKPSNREKAQDGLDLIDRLSRCDVHPGGVFVDLGSPAAQGVIGWWSLSADSMLTDVERDGETWARLSGRKIVWRFVLDEPDPLSVSMRARAGASRSAVVSLDGRPLGTLSLTRSQSRVAATHVTQAAVAAGAHALELRFTGAARNQGEPAAEIDWVRAATSDEAGTFAPPTMGQIVSNVALGAVPHRAIALRAPASVRCPMLMPSGGRLEMSLGFEGPGSGEAEVVLLRDGEAASTLYAGTIEGGDRAEWQAASVDLPDLAGKVATLELRAKSSAVSGRLLFGDPAIRAPKPAIPDVPGARLVVVVALSGIDRSRLTNADLYPALADLARGGVTFTAHRAPTTVSAGVIASLLTGRSPGVHGVQDSGARLPNAITTIGVAASEGSVQTGMFSGCPSTFDAFGFARGWDKYASFSPVEGAPAVAPITEALRWATDHMKSETARALVVVHARGGHPPWDVTLSEASKLAPFDYSGPMEPRRAGQLIARGRAKHARFHLNENDRARMWALYEVALAGQDQAIGAFVDGLKKAALWNDTLFVVTGDVSVPSDSRAPFGEGEDLSEELLALPLFVHFPGGALGGTKIAVPTSIFDISRSALDALHLPVPEGFEGMDLFEIASGAAPAGGRPLFATLGSKYSLRLGDYVLSGADGRAPSLCDIAADRNCEIDRAEKMPRAASLLFRMAYDAETTIERQRLAREPATVDGNTAAALQVWGEYAPVDESANADSRR